MTRRSSGPNSGIHGAGRTGANPKGSVSGSRAAGDGALSNPHKLKTGSTTPFQESCHRSCLASMVAFRPEGGVGNLTAYLAQDQDQVAAEGWNPMTGPSVIHGSHSTHPTRDTRTSTMTGATYTTPLSPDNTPSLPPRASTTACAGRGCCGPGP